jgi:hypothetical protein
VISPAGLPLVLLQPSAGSCRYKGIARLTDYSEGKVRSFSDPVWRASRYILAQGVAKHLAARPTRAPHKAFNGIEKIIGNGDFCFHSGSIIIAIIGDFGS